MAASYSFCYIAERGSLVRLRETHDIALDWRGFELHPETPKGGRAVAELFGAQRAAAMGDYLREFASGFGIQDMKAPERLQNTRGILAASEYAREQGRLDPFREAAMDAYWKESRNLEDPAVVRDLARAAGVDAEATAAAMTSPDHLARIEATRQEASRLGVSGIPTFFIGAQRIVGCQPYEVLAAAVEASR